MRESTGDMQSSVHTEHTHTHMHTGQRCAGNCRKLHVSSCNLYLSGPVDLNLSPAEHNTWTCWTSTIHSFPPTNGRQLDNQGNCWNHRSHKPPKNENLQHSEPQLNCTQENSHFTIHLSVKVSACQWKCVNIITVTLYLVLYCSIIMLSLQLSLLWSYLCSHTSYSSRLDLFAIYL